MGYSEWTKEKNRIRDEVKAAGKWLEFVRLRGTLQATGSSIQEAYRESYRAVMQGVAVKRESEVEW